MKKSLVLILAGLVLCMTACGKKEEVVPDPEPTLAPVQQEIEVGGGDEIIDITRVPKEEWPNITWEQIRDFTLAFLPNYRTTYGISEDRVMEEKDWVKMKELMFYQLFGQIYSEYVSVGEVYHDIETVEDKYGADWIYFEPTEEYLMALEPDDIAEYFQNFYPKVFNVTPTDNAGNPVKFRDLTDQELIAVRNMFVNEKFYGGAERYKVDAGNSPERTPAPTKEPEASEEPDLSNLTEEEAEVLLEGLLGGDEE